MTVINIQANGEPITINILPAQEPTEPQVPSAIPEVQTIAELQALDSSVTMVMLRRPPRAIMFPMFANQNIPEVDARADRLSMLWLLIRGDALLTWAGNQNASPTQPSRYGYIDLGSPSEYADPTNGGWLVPAADVESEANVLPQGWVPLQLI